MKVLWTRQAVVLHVTLTLDLTTPSLLTLHRLIIVNIYVRLQMYMKFL